VARFKVVSVNTSPDKGPILNVEILEDTGPRVISRITVRLEWLNINLKTDAELEQIVRGLVIPHIPLVDVKNALEGKTFPV